MERERSQNHPTLVWRLIEGQLHAVPKEIYWQENMVKDLLQRRFLEREINLQEYLQETNHLRFPGAVECTCFAEFREVLVDILSLPRAEVRRIINHERSHYETAEEAGFENLRYGLQYVKPENHGFLEIASYFVTFSIPSSMDDERARSGLRKVIAAPGKEMSVSDRKCLPVPEPAFERDDIIS